MSTIPTSVTEEQFEQHIHPYLLTAQRGYECKIPLYKVFNMRELYLCNRRHSGKSIRTGIVSVPYAGIIPLQCACQCLTSQKLQSFSSLCGNYTSAIHNHTLADVTDSGFSSLCGNYTSASNESDYIERLNVRFSSLCGNYTSARLLENVEMAKEAVSVPYAGIMPLQETTRIFI